MGMLGIKDRLVRTSKPLLFNRAGLVYGARRSLPLAFGVFAYGLVFGVLAQQAGLVGSDESTEGRSDAGAATPSSP